MEMKTHQQVSSSNLHFVDIQAQKTNVSYSGYTKSAVFSQWHKSLLKQQYEEACHWTAELDASLWHKDLWQKIILFASKQVHLHCPKLPLIVARNFAYYQIYIIKHSQQDKNEYQPRNHHQLQKNLCQVIGLLALGSKGPVYTLPNIDIHKIDGGELVSGTHAWLMTHQKSQDDASILRIMSTLLCQLEACCTHKIMYWLGVLIEYEKHQKQQKETIQMASRKPILPDDHCYKHVFVNGANACDWVWLLWQAILHGCCALGKSKECIDTLKALGYLFAHDYTTSKRNSRMPILIHALQLVYTDIQWYKSIYTAQNEPLIDRACQNIHLLYKDIRDQRKQVQRSNVVSTAVDNSTTHHKHNEPKSHSATKTNVKSQNTNQRASKHTMSSDSYSKMDTFSKIDALFLGL